MKLRVRFSKRGKVRFTSHRDVARMWERALRRTDVQVAYSVGFSPRPKLSFGLALPTGAESLAEYVDIDLAAPVSLDGLCPLLSEALPIGIDATAVEVLEGRVDSLQESVVSCGFVLELVGVTAEQVNEAVNRLLASDEVLVTRSRKGAESTDDVRPAIEHLEVMGDVADHDGVMLVAHLATKPRGLRPAELVEAMAVPIADTRVLRTHQWIEIDGERAELLAIAEPLALWPEGVSA